MKLALFIDGVHLFSAARSLGFEIDYKQLLAWGAAQGDLVRAHYYTPISTREDDHIPLQPLVDWLDYNGYAVTTKDVREYADSEGRKKVKGNINIELAMDMIDMAPYVDRAILFSGDGDLWRLVESVQRKGVRVTVASTIKTSPAMVADDLRRQADCFLDIDNIKEIRKPARTMAAVGK